MRTHIRIGALTSSRRFAPLAAALLLTICAASSHAGSNAVRDADGSRISVTSVGGDVDFTMAGNSVQASPNDTVLLPARIVTGHDGSVGLTQAGTNVSVANDSDVEIPSEAVDGNLIARMVQHRGNVFYDVAPRDLGKLRVETPFLVAVIKGTQFNVAVDDQGTTISLFEGSLEIHTPDDSDIIQLNAGEIAIRSLIDDSIRIVGMDDARVEIPAAAPAVAEESAQPSTAAPTDSAAVADDAPAVRANPSPVVAVEVATPVAAPLDAAIRARVDVAEIKPSIAVNTVVDRATVELSIAESVVEVARDVGVDVLERVDPLDNVGDVKLDVGDVKLDADVGPTLDTGADLRIDAGLDLRGTLDTDAGLDLGGALDTDAGLDLGSVVDAGVDLALDTGAGDLTLDAGGGVLDLDLNIDVGGDQPVVDLQLDIDPGPGVRAPVPLPPR
jgi:FecR-like protein